ncbi:unnamed protein product [Brassica napus]|uniref:(rape) hypothetical protein n=1 Tax=Brassica napus TaxID=3708 RepID=A0A816IAG1_BRANA|nr:unnamed protein product [Brassica napus]
MIGSSLGISRKQGNENKWGLGSGWVNNKHVSDVNLVCVSSTHSCTSNIRDE